MKDALEERVYGFDDEVGSNALEASVSRLRRKLLTARSGVRIEAARGIGWSRAIGTGVFAEAVDEAALLAGAPVAVLSDRALMTSGQAQASASAALRRSSFDRALARITVPPHAGQEPGDVIEVTDASMGWAAERFRVLAVRLEYARAPRPRYEMTLLLGEP